MLHLVFIPEGPSKDKKACIMQTFDSWHLLHGYYISSDSRIKFMKGGENIYAKLAAFILQGSWALISLCRP